jgi:hypothetical protein
VAASAGSILHPNLHGETPSGRIIAVSAEQLIALEAAVAELGTLYVIARSLAALQVQAETELLPRTISLASRLRSLVRAAKLTPGEMDSAAREILALRSQWRLELDQVRASATYQQALAALSTDRQEELATLVPRVFAGVRIAQPHPDLYFPVSPSSGRRRPGSGPFLSAADCADKIAGILAEGVMPEDAGSEWWERELPFISCAATPAALDTPISLRLAASDASVTVFAVLDEPGFRIFTPRLRRPMSVLLATAAPDEWWEAYEDSYHAFRDALQRELAGRGYSVSMVNLDATLDP